MQSKDKILEKHGISNTLNRLLRRLILASMNEWGDQRYIQGRDEALDKVAAIGDHIIYAGQKKIEDCIKTLKDDETLQP